MSITEKASYLKGLAEGLDYDKTTKEGKIIAALIDLVDDMAKELDEAKADIADLQTDIDSLNEYAEELDDDLEDVEDFLDELCDEADELEDDEDDFECDGDCENCDNEDCKDENYMEIVCPSCGETICFDSELDPESIVCPACGEKIGCIVDEDDYKKLSEEK
ncbi:MAG: hypothetical protein IJR88_00325 [Clostridia bacterium]|nr:hypothetical protein [Clostridia bacterium]